MERVRFNCSECDTKLGVSPALAGKAIACPKCRAKNTVPSPEKDEPPPPLRFPCTKCGTKLRALAQLAGQAIPCPRCGENTIVPDQDEIGSYGFAGASQSDDDEDENRSDPPLAEWWPDGGKLKLPLTWRTKLDTARAYSEDEKWTKALGLLNDLFQAELHSKGKIGTHVLRKPLAYCLGHWAAREIDRLDDDGVKLSKPVRQVLKKAADMQRWGGTLKNNECPLCDRELLHLVGTTQIRTVAGSAYVCCAKPTSLDDELVRRVAKINKKLVLATGLDPDNHQVPAAMKLLPDWYRIVDMHASTWTRPVVDDDMGRSGGGGGGGGGSAGGSLAGNVVGEVLANLLFG